MTLTPAAWTRPGLCTGSTNCVEVTVAPAPGPCPAARRIATHPAATAARRKQVATLYAQPGASIRTVADRLHVSRSTVRRDLAACQVRSRPRGGGAIGRKFANVDRRKLTRDQCLAIRDAYTSDPVVMRDLAALYGVSASLISRVCKGTHAEVRGLPDISRNTGGRVTVAAR